MEARLVETAAHRYVKFHAKVLTLPAAVEQ